MNLQPLVNMYNVLKNSSDPLEVLRQKAPNNPMVNDAIAAINLAGGNYSRALQMVAQSKGLTNEQVQSMLSQLNQMFS